MRVGGGIYTKAADVGADLVGKVEKDIPEDDPRNAAVVADLVGDNVGDCAGMAADIFESYEVTIVSALLLGLALVAADPAHELKWIVYPLIIRGIGVISSILGTFTVPIWEKFPLKFLRAHNAEEAMFRSYEVSSINTIFFSFLVAILYANDWRLAMLTSIGVALAVVFNPLTSYFTSVTKPPVREIVDSTETGPATTILSGLSVGMELSVYALIAIAISFILALLLYRGDGALYVLYAVAMVGIGMLSHTGNNVAMDSYGPISDNANGIGEMAWHDRDDEETKKARQIMADLDAVGNTTKAITKGIAIASAVIAAVSLFASFITDVGRVQASLGIAGIGIDPCLSHRCIRWSVVRRCATLDGQLALDPGGEPSGRRDRNGSTAPVPYPGHHGRYRKAGLCPRSQYFDYFCSERADPPGNNCSAHADPGWSGPGSGGPGRFPGGCDLERSAAGGIYG